ncbi:hypothetical protein IVP19_10665 [Enterococcus faecium]|uniref:hypothetical protein n=1 Tax=Enterococcus faecium TaxID=1352 RepID=UPI001E2FB47A|nr:hypothetical protein [Enterococcus faecium]MCD5115335.1 hypothetical protein [Enterococcus faecium]MCD5218001.1 hypothetical protein [Enterococcus faecium]
MKDITQRYLVSTKTVGRVLDSFFEEPRKKRLITFPIIFYLMNLKELATVKEPCLYYQRYKHREDL